jgi:oligoribonuclease NrnB/cAMP/cGMP phosphodiesterase (DHH superfamily)
MPTIIHHIGRWDVWDHSDEETTLVHFGLMSQDARVDSPIWWKLLPATPEERSTPEYVANYMALLHDGEILRRYKMVQDARTAKAGYFTTKLDGHTVLAINAGGNSDLLASVWDPTKWEFVLLFVLNYRGWKVSLFQSTGGADVNVGEIAKRYGGGGHRGAAGFTVGAGQPLPFKTPADADWGK